MSDKFYDFDKDAAFDEVYSDKVLKKPSKKEYEIEISMPKTELKSTMPQKQATTPKAKQQKSVKPKKKKMSKGKIALATVGIILSCLIVYLGSFLLTILNWHKLPSFKQAEKSTIEDVKKTDEYVVISDDGETVEVVPMYKDVPSSDTSSEEDEESTETESGETKDEENEDEETSSEDTPSNGNGGAGNDEVIDV